MAVYCDLGHARCYTSRGIGRLIDWASVALLHTGCPQWTLRTPFLVGPRLYLGRSESSFVYSTIIIAVLGSLSVGMKAIRILTLYTMQYYSQDITEEPDNKEEVVQQNPHGI